MAKRTDLKKIVIFGSGPIVIGQACEFDYSGTQACKALMSEGYEVILINSNPATIMTDPEVATRVYIEPLNPTFVTKVLEKEKPDAVIPTLGGQTALNLALSLHGDGTLDRLGIELLGAIPEVIEAAEDREKFCGVLDKVGAQYPKSKMITRFEDGESAVEELGLPIILRPNYTLGGGGGGIAYSLEEYKSKLAIALHESPTSEVLVEESILGWKEFELEVMRDKDGTFVVICSIENLDPCGVHTGDSITVAPQQTLSDREYQALRDEGQKIIEEVGVETGGANIQFAVDQESGRRVVIEMNPRVSRSSALASKATGFPIAKIAALLAVGYTLDEIRNDITKTTPSCYEPALDYVVTKIPRFAFEKFSGAKDLLSTQMKSVGEVMGVGRTFKESLNKALLSLEGDPRGAAPVEFSEQKLCEPNSRRIFQLFQAYREGHSVEQLFKWTQITPWFLEQIHQMVEVEKSLQTDEMSKELMLKAKRYGYSDAAIAWCQKRTTQSIKKQRRDWQIEPSYNQVDTCAGEFASTTPYYYSTYWGDREPSPKSEKSIAILGSGPNRIGQGIEFDYSCVRSVGQFQKEGYFVSMINSNPETVSTDYDTSNELFFEPLSLEHVEEVLRYIQPDGFVAQLGGQTPIGLAPDLVSAGYELMGSSVVAMDLAEDRGQFVKICQELEFRIPKSGMASNVSEALELADQIEFPIMCRPSYVLGGRRMEIVESREDLEGYFEKHGHYISEDCPCLMDQFLERALEVDVDLVRGKDWVVVGGVIEHIEAAGVHSGDSMGVIPPQRLKPGTCHRIEQLSKKLADRLGVIGFLNLQLAVKDDEVYMIEANPRSSRSVPFMVKATQVPLVNLGVKAIVGASSSDVNPSQFDWLNIDNICVKGVVFPFKKFKEADSILGPEMKSTGESMGRGRTYSEALYKAYLSSKVIFPHSGEVFLSLRDKDKKELLPVVRDLEELGYTFSATGGTADFLKENGVKCEKVKKVHEGRPNCVDRIRSGDVGFVVNTTSGRTAIEASFGIRRSCTDYSIPCITESDAAASVVEALKGGIGDSFSVSPLRSTPSV